MGFLVASHGHGSAGTRLRPALRGYAVALRLALPSTFASTGIPTSDRVGTGGRRGNVWSYWVNAGEIKAKE